LSFVVTDRWWWIFLGTEEEAQEAELTAKEELARFANAAVNQKGNGALSREDENRTANQNASSLLLTAP
jgi:hypothetical protein